MNLNEAKQLLNDNGYAIDEGIGNFVKKARRAVFGKNKDDEAILAKRQKRLAQKAEEHRQHDAQWEKRQNMWDDVTSECFRYLQKKIKNEDEGISGIYEVLVKLRKKYGKQIYMSIAGSTYSQAIDIGVILKDMHHANDGGYGYGYDSVGIGRIGFYSNENRHHDDFAGYKMEYANSYKEALNHKYTQTKDLNEWYNEIDDIANEILNNIKKADVNDWEQNIDQNESVKIKQALKYLRENGYQINEDLPAKDQDAFQWRTFRKDANKILAGFAAKFIELAATELVQESGEAVDMNELWDSVGGKDEFIKTLITDENEVLLDYVGELWQAANNAKNLNIK